MKFPWTKPTPPTPLETARAQRLQAEIDQLAAERDAEHFAHQVAMIKARVARLKAHEAALANKGQVNA